jgi:four helix bundle protein
LSIEIRENIVRDKAFKFSIRIIRLYQYLVKEKKEYLLTKQIVRSGTSIGANIEEALGGVSRKDFSHKLSIAYKEARETEYWLKLLFETDFINKKMYESIYNDCNELSKILFSILKKTKNY